MFPLGQLLDRIFSTLMDVDDWAKFLGKKPEELRKWTMSQELPDSYVLCSCFLFIRSSDVNKVGSDLLEALTNVESMMLEEALGPDLFQQHQAMFQLLTERTVGEYMLRQLLRATIRTFRTLSLALQQRLLYSLAETARQEQDK